MLRNAPYITLKTASDRHMSYTKIKILAFLTLAAIVFLFAINDPETEKVADEIIQSSLSTKCKIANCHGDPICAPIAPPPTDGTLVGCSLEKRRDDICRGFASCQSMFNKCLTIKSPKFYSCKSCVKACEREQDSFNFWDCARKCTT